MAHLWPIFAPRKNPHVLNEFRRFPNNVGVGPDIRLIPTAAIRKFTRARPRICQNIESANFAKKAIFRPIVDPNRALPGIEAAKSPLNYSGKWDARMAEPQ